MQIYFQSCLCSYLPRVPILVEDTVTIDSASEGQQKGSCFFQKRSTIPSFITLITFLFYLNHLFILFYFYLRNVHLSCGVVSHISRK